MKVGDKLVATGYRPLKEGHREEFPGFLRSGVHKVSKIKTSAFGTLVKTDRQPNWLNVGWFRKVQ